MARTTNNEDRILTDAEYEKLLQQQETLQKELKEMESSRPAFEMKEPKDEKDLQEQINALRSEKELKELIRALGREEDLKPALKGEDELMEELATLKAQRHIALSVKNALEEVQSQDGKAQEEDTWKLFLAGEKKEELKAREQEYLNQLVNYEEGKRFEKKWLQNDEDLKIRKAAMDSAAKKSADSKKELNAVIERIRENRREQEVHGKVTKASLDELREYLENCEKNYVVEVSEENLKKLNHERNLLLESNREIAIRDENELRAAVTGEDEDAVKLASEVEELIRKRRRAEKAGMPQSAGEKAEYLGITDLHAYADAVKKINYQGLPDNEKKLFQRQTEVTKEEGLKLRHDIEAVVSHRLEKERKILFMEDRLGIESFDEYEEKMYQILALAARYNNIFDYKEKMEPLSAEERKKMLDLQAACYTEQNGLEQKELERLSAKAVRRQLDAEETKRFDEMKENLRQKRTQKVLSTKKAENDFTRLKQLEERDAARMYQDILRMDRILLEEVREMNAQYKEEAEKRKRALAETEKLLLKDIREENKKRKEERKAAKKEITLEDLKERQAEKEQQFLEDTVKELEAAESAAGMLEQQAAVFTAADKAVGFLAGRFAVSMDAYISALSASRIHRLENELEELKKQEGADRKNRERLAKTAGALGKEITRLSETAEQYTAELEEIADLQEQGREEDRKRKSLEKKLEKTVTARAEKYSAYRKNEAELDALDQRLQETGVRIGQTQEQLTAETDAAKKLHREVRRILISEREERHLYLDIDTGKTQKEADLRMVQLSKAIAGAEQPEKTAAYAEALQEAVGDIYAEDDLQKDEKLVGSLKACYQLICELSVPGEETPESMEKIDAFGEQLGVLRDRIHDAELSEEKKLDEKLLEEIRDATAAGQGFWDTLSAQTAMFAAEQKLKQQRLERVPAVLRALLKEWEASGKKETSFLSCVTEQLQERYMDVEEEDRKQEQKTAAEEKALYAKKLKLTQQSGKDATAAIKAATAYQAERKKKIRQVRETAAPIRKELKETQKQIAESRKALDALQTKYDARREDILQRERQIEEKANQIRTVEGRLEEKNLKMSIVEKAKQDLNQLKKAKEDLAKLEYLNWLQLHNRRESELLKLAEQAEKAKAAREATKELEETKRKDIEFLAKLSGKKAQELRTDSETLYDALDRIYVNGLSATEYFRVMAPELNINKPGAPLKADAAVEISRMLREYLEEPVRKGAASTFIATEDDKGMLCAVKAHAEAGDAESKKNVTRYNRIAEQMYADMNKVRKDILQNKKKDRSAEESMRQATLQTAVRISEGSHRKKSIVNTEKKKAKK